MYNPQKKEPHRERRNNPLVPMIPQSNPDVEVMTTRAFPVTTPSRKETKA